MLEVTLAPLAVAGLTGLSITLGQLGADTQVSLGTAASVAIFAGANVAFLIRKLQRIEDCLAEQGRTIDKIVATLDARQYTASRSDSQIPKQ